MCPPCRSGLSPTPLLPSLCGSSTAFRGHNLPVPVLRAVLVECGVGERFSALTSAAPYLRPAKGVALNKSPIKTRHLYSVLSLTQSREGVVSSRVPSPPFPRLRSRRVPVSWDDLRSVQSDSSPRTDDGPPRTPDVCSSGE